MFTLQSGRTLRWACVVLSAALALGHADPAVAQSLPVELGEIDPAGPPGTWLLCGPEATAEQILSALVHRDNRRSLHALFIGESPAVSVSDLQRHAAAGVTHWSATWEQVDWSSLNVADDAGVWVHAPRIVAGKQQSTTSLSLWLTALAQRRIPCAVSGTLTQDLFESQVQPSGKVTANAPELSLLKGVVGRNRAGDKFAPETIRQLQWQLDPQALLWIRGRSLHVPDASVGGVGVWLPGDAAQPVPSLRIDRDHFADLTMLRRAAVLRSAPPFPPANVSPPTIENGALVIVGGGTIPPEIHARFIELAGGPEARIVVIPTAGELSKYEEHRDADRFRDSGAREVTILHTRDRRTAADERFLAPLRAATGVWFCGGRQWRLVDAYEGTPFVTACRAVLERGGVIGGTSAGATILGEYLVRGHPLGNEAMMAEGYERGFAFLPGAAIDQHFTQRQREADLELVHRTHPQLTCVGIDERTALIVRGSRGTVHGAGSVTLLPPRRDGAPAADDSGGSRLQPGDTIDFAATAPVPPGDASSTDAAAVHD